jgi:hypothetical protein
MERLVSKFRDFEDADEADRSFYLRMTPQERLAVMLDLIYPEDSGAASSRLERVYRMIKLGDS